MVNLTVNGQQQSFDGDTSMPLMWYLRDELGLTGTKFGCGVALCGACTVHLNGEAVPACGISMADVSGKSARPGGAGPATYGRQLACRSSRAYRSPRARQACFVDLRYAASAAPEDFLPASWSGHSAPPSIR